MLHFLSSLCLLVAATLGTTGSAFDCPDGDLVEIIIINGEGDDSIPNRSPSEVPIIGYADAVLNMVSLSFLSPCGN